MHGEYLCCVWGTPKWKWETYSDHLVGPVRRVWLYAYEMCSIAQHGMSKQIWISERWKQYVQTIQYRWILQIHCCLWKRCSECDRSPILEIEWYDEMCANCFRYWCKRNVGASKKSYEKTAIWTGWPKSTVHCSNKKETLKNLQLGKFLEQRQKCWCAWKKSRMDMCGDRGVSSLLPWDAVAIDGIFAVWYMPSNRRFQRANRHSVINRRRCEWERQDNCPVCSWTSMSCRIRAMCGA